jgi:hypothetical protein
VGGASIECPTRSVAALLKPKRRADGKDKCAGARHCGTVRGRGAEEDPDPRDTPGGRRYQFSPGVGVRMRRSFVKKRSVVTCLAALAGMAVIGVGVGSRSLLAASAQVDQAIKSIQTVANDAGKLKLFCELNELLQEAGDKEDAEATKKVEDLITQIGTEFSAAWDVGDELDENSPDGQEFYAAVDNLADKCD